VFRVLVEEKSEVRSGPVGRADRQEHGVLSSIGENRSRAAGCSISLAELAVDRVGSIIAFSGT